jgi:hypothetical protein
MIRKGISPGIVIADSDLSKRLGWIQQLFGFFSILFLLSRPRLYMAVRAFPLLPALPIAGALPALAHWFLLGVSVFSLLISILRPKSGVWLLGWLIGITLLTVLDQCRMQSFLFTAYLAQWALAAWRMGWVGNPTAWRLLGWQFAAIYGFNGLNKLTPWFGETIFPLELHRLTTFLPLSWVTLLKPFSSAIPIWEMGTALLLLIPITRGMGIGLATLLHLCIVWVNAPHTFYFLDMLSIYNLSLIPVLWWWGSRMPQSLCVWPSGWGSWAMGTYTLIISWVLPFWHLTTGNWVGNLSYDWYTGTYRASYILVNASASEKLYPSARRYIKPIRGGRYKALYLDSWMFYQYRSEFIQNPLGAKGVAQHLKPRMQTGDSIWVLVLRQPAPFIQLQFPESGHK